MPGQMEPKCESDRNLPYRPTFVVLINATRTYARALKHQGPTGDPLSLSLPQPLAVSSSCSRPGLDPASALLSHCFRSSVSLLPSPLCGASVCLYLLLSRFYAVLAHASAAKPSHPSAWCREALLRASPHTNASFVRSPPSGLLHDPRSSRDHRTSTSSA